MIDYTLLTPSKIIKSKRKTLSLTINRDGELLVKCPIYCSKRQIYDFIFKKADWVVKTRKNIFKNKRTLNFADDEIVPILGKDYTFKLSDNHKVIIDNGIIFLPKTATKEKFLKFIKSFAKNYIVNRVEELAKNLNLTYKSIKINSAKSRYGSCGSNNTLNFTFRLIFAKTEVVDYIILHELAHIKEKNHQKPFYDLLSSYCKNYKDCEKWLKNNKYILDLVD